MSEETHREIRKLSLQNACTEISDLQRRLSAAEKERDELRRAISCLDIGGENDAADNLCGALTDLEHGSNDGVVHKTIGRVIKQITDLEMIFAALKNAGGNEG